MKVFEICQILTNALQEMLLRDIVRSCELFGDGLQNSRPRIDYSCVPIAIVGDLPIQFVIYGF